LTASFILDILQKQFGCYGFSLQSISC